MHGPMNIKLVFHIYLGTIHKACSLITNMYTLCGRNAEFLIMMCIYIYIYIYITVPYVFRREACCWSYSAVPTDI